MQPQQDQNYWQPATEPAEQVAQVPDLPPVELAEAEVVAEPADAPQPISWQASEFVHHEKSMEWFLALVGIAVILLLIDVFLIKSWTFGALIVVMAVSAIAVARRPPRTLTYLISPSGIQIDEKQFRFHDFRAFGVVQEGAFYSIRLIPVKRFMPMVNVYFPPEHGEEIVDIFGSILPMEKIQLDFIDKLVEKIRF
jgi:hypothetical protein